MKYLFGCEFDNEVYLQTPEDVSRTNPKKSAFFDVMDKKIERFWLTGEGHKYLVDLRDGHFEIDGLPFKLHEEDLSDFRIIYFRRHTLELSGTTEVGHKIEFCIGWQTTKDKNYKQIMTII